MYGIFSEVIVPIDLIIYWDNGSIFCIDILVTLLVESMECIIA
jgi:hypothetical protein